MSRIQLEPKKLLQPDAKTNLFRFTNNFFPFFSPKQEKSHRRYRHFRTTMKLNVEQNGTFAKVFCFSELHPKKKTLNITLFIKGLNIF